jgi:GNAT superfamily N-acetyltransferase
MRHICRPLRETDDRALFDCGRDSLNAWFRRHAWTNHSSSVSRVNVIEQDGRVIGYVTLSVAQIERGFLPKPRQRNRPDPVPATLLGQLAVDAAYQGRGASRSLLLFALRTALQVSDAIGSLGVVTHPLDDGVRGFYERWGFQDLPLDPKRAMFVRMTDIRASFDPL